MNAANRPKAIFLLALEHATPTERSAFIAQECGTDDELRKQVDALLEAHAAADSFLEKPAAALGATIDSLPPSDANNDQPGLRVGPYKLLERIGEGGMGTVWMAEQQQPVRRLVALKLIKAGMDSRAVLARFEAERQALALMDHPNIARVLDAGAASDGRPYFVMELVKGTPLVTFCDTKRLTTRQRLELFVAVCQAIQHAHQKGVIHRDIKPSNVLVALYDDKPVPKVIDFGVAKSTGQSLTEKTLHTGFGAIIGTLEYMSPEQATFNQLDIDTRSDVYSLGVLLYELLTGTTPVDRVRLKETALLELLRVVREEEPQRPSVKLSTVEGRARIAAGRGGEPEKLAQELRGEIDWVVMKALEKDRNRRYESAASLGRDVERYLKDEMVEARPPSTWYRVRRFLGKNRNAFVAALILLGLMTAWLVTTLDTNRKLGDHLVEAIRATNRAELEAQAAQREREKARAAEAEAKALLSFFTMTVINPSLDSLLSQGDFTNITLKEALLLAEKRVETSFRDNPLLKARVRQMLGTGLTALGEGRVASEELLEKALAVYKKELGPTHPDTVNVMMTLASASQANDKPERAIELLKEAIQINKAKATSSEDAELMTDSLLCMLAGIYEEAKRFDEALRIRRDRVAAHREADGDPVQALHDLGRSFLLAGRAAEAEPVLREALALYERRRALENDWFNFVIQGDLGECLAAQKKHTEAEKWLRQSFDELAKRQGKDWRNGPVADHVIEAGERLAKFYEGAGRAEDAAKVRQELAKRKAPKKP